MKKEIAVKWIKALRSGKYKQGIGALCELNGKTAKYCCLGVLCHINDVPYYKSGNYKEYYSSLTSLSEELMEKFGLKSSTGTFFSNKKSLVGLNDDGKSFKEIADIIEANWKKL